MNAYTAFREEHALLGEPTSVDRALAASLLESSYYAGPDASSAIMHLTHFPDEVLPLLQMEGLAAHEAASVFGCGMIVEFGCYDGRALEVARFAGTRYLGIDMDQEVISALRGRIKEEGMENVASAISCHALQCWRWRKEVVGTKPLHLLAFNLLGSFRDPLALLQSLTEVGGIAVVSVFSGSARATEIRRAYYTKCGVRSLRQTDGFRGGVVFTGDGEFYSQSFSEHGLRALVRESGATVLRSAGNGVGHCLTVLLGDHRNTAF